MQKFDQFFSKDAMSIVNTANSTKVRGRELRFLRKRRFSSADAFSAACGSVSTPTIYRAERGGPVLMSYLATMARELGVEVERLVADDIETPSHLPDLTGIWVGLYIGTDRFGQPYLIEEEVNLLQNGNTVEGQTIIETRHGTMRDLLIDSVFIGNVFSGQTRSEVWPFPQDCAAFVTSGIRNFTQLDGYITWFDPDTERPEFSRYVLTRRDSGQFAEEIAHARALLDDENTLMRIRRLLELGYSFEHSVDLVAIDGNSTRQDQVMAIPGAAEGLNEVAGVNAESGTGGTVVAVSSLVVLDPDATQKFYADGLIDDIATDLARIRELTVLPRSSFPDGKPVEMNLALSRNASHVLSGSLQRADNRLRINAFIMDTSDGKVIWAKRYEHSVVNVFKAHEEISKDIIAAFNLERAWKSREIVVTNAPDPHAYELFLKARSLYLCGIYTHSLRAAEALLVRAATIDPRFARAHALISICRSHLALSNVQPLRAEEIDVVASDAEQALQIDPYLPLGFAALGLEQYSAGEYRNAEANFRTAIDLDQQLFEAHFFLARNLRLQGDRSGAAESFAIACTLRPEDFRSTGLLGEELQALGRHDEARIQFQTSLRSVEQVLAKHPDNADALAFGAAVSENLGQHERAATWSEWALAIAPDDSFVRYNVARTHAIAGDPATALELLERAFSIPPDQRRRLGLWLKFDRDFEALATNPRFRILANI